MKLTNVILLKANTQINGHFYNEDGVKRIYTQLCDSINGFRSLSNVVLHIGNDDDEPPRRFGFAVDLKNAVGSISKCSYKDGVLYGDLNICKNYPKGAMIQNLIRNKASLYMCTVITGTINEDKSIGDDSELQYFKIVDSESGIEDYKINL